MLLRNLKSGILISMLLLCQCNGRKNSIYTKEETVLIASFGSHGTEMEKVLRHYIQQPDERKRKAAIILLKNLSDQYHSAPAFLKYYDKVFEKAAKHSDKSHYINQQFDSLSQWFEVRQADIIPDIEVVTSEMLIENIDYAFKAWQLPWSRALSFDDFCTYILPYKVEHERPVYWRRELFEQLMKVIDTTHSPTTRKQLCKFVNEKLTWFKYQWPFNYPVPLDYPTMLLSRTGKCSDATALAVYVMRAIGLPVTVDFTSQWGNRNYGHSWNALLCEDGKFINFQGTETSPGETKIEYDPKEDWSFKRAKIFRKTYSKTDVNHEIANQQQEHVPPVFYNEFYEDVTATFLPVTSIYTKHKGKKHFSYLCVFDNQNWMPVAWAKPDEQFITFKNVGKNILYAIADYQDGRLNITETPFSVLSDGRTTYYIPDTLHLENITLQRKYPYNNSNLIKKGDSYELSYWNHEWKSLGEQVATENFLVYRNVPRNALLILRDLSRGRQQRPFVIENKEQIFW